MKLTKVDRTKFIHQKEPKDGNLCRKCWIKIEMFHEFYRRIQTIHDVPHTAESIFVSYINVVPKVSLSTDDQYMNACGDVKDEGKLRYLSFTCLKIQLKNFQF